MRLCLTVLLSHLCKLICDAATEIFQPWISLGRRFFFAPLCAAKRALGSEASLEHRFVSLGAAHCLVSSVVLKLELKVRFASR
jgi:hypothetical protein